VNGTPMDIHDAAAPGMPPESDGVLQSIGSGGEGDSPVVERVSYLGFVVGVNVYGLPLDQLREVAPLKRLRRIPGAPRHVAGLMNLRGEIVCALDTRAILSLAGAPPPSAGGFLIALRGFPDPLGLVVDSITDVYAIDPAVVESPPETWPAARAALSLGTATVPEGVMTLLDLRRMIEAMP
jgi:purine-binding chemotaxis protein CheW